MSEVPPIADRSPDVSGGTFDSLLAEVASLNPTVAAILGRAHANRTSSLAQWKAGVTTAGLDEFMTYLDSVMSALRRTRSLRRLSFLVERCTDDFAVALDAIMGGEFGVVSDSMRDVMEVEFLLREFAQNPSAVDDWLAATESERMRKYSANRLRQLEASRRGIDPKDLSDSMDYKAHSMSLHVTPIALNVLPRGIGLAPHPFSVQFAYYELYEHGRRLVFALYKLKKAVAPTAKGWKSPVRLTRFRRGFEAVNFMSRVFQEMLFSANTASPGKIRGHESETAKSGDQVTRD